MREADRNWLANAQLAHARFAEELLEVVEGVLDQSFTDAELKAIWKRTGATPPAPDARFSWEAGA